MLRVHPIVLALLFGLLVVPATSFAQQSPGGAYTGPATKEQLLQSSRFRRVERKYDEWLSVQRMYDAGQVAQMKARYKQKVQAMSATQLEDFISMAEEKLDVLLSSEASEARSYMSFYTDDFLKKKMGDSTPSIASMSPTQMRQELSNFKERRSSRASAQQEFNRLQTQNVQAQMQRQNQIQSQQQAYRQGLTSGSLMANQRFGHPYHYNTPYRSPYAPGQYVAPRPQFTVSPWGGVWRTLP